MEVVGPCHGWAGAQGARDMVGVQQCPGMPPAVLGMVALAWRPAVCREGTHHGHEHSTHHGHGGGISKRGVSHGHGHGHHVSHGRGGGIHRGRSCSCTAHVASPPPPRTPPALAGRLFGGHQPLKSNHLSMAKGVISTRVPPKRPGLSQRRGDAAGPVAEGLPLPALSPRSGTGGHSGTRMVGLSCGGTFCSPTRVLSYHLALLRRGSGCGRGGGHGQLGGGRRGPSRLPRSSAAV